jgi:hypothetical protein
MNLYKIQEELKFKSIPELQHFANGMDPKVPAWMASSVLKAKVDERERFANMQGAAKGQMPSVKEQLEQKAGLMQQQASQAPMGLAQPMAQPPQGPVQMPGGLTSGSAGSGMQFAEGGIVGFDGTTGSYVGRSKGSNVLPDKTGYEGMGLWEAIKAMGGDFSDYLAATEKASLQGPTTARPLKPGEYNPTIAKEDTKVITDQDGTSYTVRAGTPFATSSNSVYAPKPDGSPGVYIRPANMSDSDWAENVKSLGGHTPMAPTGNIAGSRRTPQQLAAAGINPVVTPSTGLGGNKNVPPTGPRPPAAGGLGSSSIADMLQKQLGKEPAQPTTEDAIAAIKGIQKGFGVDQPAGNEERAMIEQMNRRYAQGQENRSMRDLRGVMSAFGRGYGAAGSEANRAEEAATNADMAQQQKVYEMLNSINKANRAEGVGAAKSAGELLSGREKSASEEGRARLQALANAYHTNVAAGAQLQSAQIMAAAREAGLDSKEIQMAESAYARDPEALAIKERMKLPQIANNPAKLEEEIRKLKAIQISKYAQFGIKMEGTTPSAGAGGTPPPGAVREVKR